MIDHYKFRRGHIRGKPPPPSEGKEEDVSIQQLKRQSLGRASQHLIKLLDVQCVPSELKSENCSLIQLAVEHSRRSVTRPASSESAPPNPFSTDT